MHEEERPVQVLILEDNPGDVFLFKQGIEERSRVPTNIQVVVDGASAMEVLQERASELPDLILLDLNVPKLDGFEVLSMLRQRNQQIPVLVLTSVEIVGSYIGSSINHSVKS